MNIKGVEMRKSELSRMCVVVTGCVLALSLGCGPVGEDQTFALEDMRQADVEFDLASAGKNIEGWSALVAEDAVFFGGGRAIEGREAVTESWAGLLDPEGPATLRWTPVDAEVSHCGDLGYTRGRFRTTVLAEDGSESVSQGWYVTIWRKSAEDGQWRAVLDIGTPPEAVER